MQLLKKAYKAEIYLNFINFCHLALCMHQGYVSYYSACCNVHVHHLPGVTSFKKIQCIYNTLQAMNHDNGSHSLAHRNLYDGGVNTYYTKFLEDLWSGKCIILLCIQYCIHYYNNLYQAKNAVYNIIHIGYIQ